MIICQHKIDLLAITETWLNVNDDAVRNELCPPSYKLCDHAHTDRTGGGTALLHRDSLHVKKTTAGEKESFELSELIVLRVIILYQPLYSMCTGFPSAHSFWSSLII